MLFRLLQNAQRTLSIARILEAELRPQRNLGHHETLTRKLLKLSFRIGTEADKFKFRILSNCQKRGHETRVDGRDKEMFRRPDTFMSFELRRCINPVSYTHLTLPTSDL